MTTTTNNAKTTKNDVRIGSIVIWGSVRATVRDVFAKTVTLAWEHDRTGLVVTRGVEFSKITVKHY